MRTKKVAAAAAAAAAATGDGNLVGLPAKCQAATSPENTFNAVKKVDR